MQSLRRVALRSATSAARAAAPKAPCTQFAARLAVRNTVVKQSTVSLARYFSQTVRLAEQNQEVEPQVSTEQLGSQQSSTEQKPSTDPPNGVWIRNFVFDVNEDHLKELFSKFGTVVETRIVRDVRGLSRGFGFVYMSSEAEAQEAVKELNGTFWHGRRIHTEKQAGQRKPVGGRGASDQPRASVSPPEPTQYLYIGNIPYEATDAELNRMFRGLENLVNVRVAVDRVTGFPRGFAHADFTDVESAKKAYEKLSGFEMGGRQLRLDYAVSSPASRKNKTSR